MADQVVLSVIITQGLWRVSGAFASPCALEQGCFRVVLALSLSCCHLQIFIRACMIVDYAKLPAGKTLLRNLFKGYSHVRYDFDSKNTHCVVKGPFTELQAFSRELLASLKLESQAVGEVPLPGSIHVAKETGTHRHQQVPDSTQPAPESAKLQNWDQESEKAAEVPPPRGPVDGEAAEQPEDFSLVMDSDVYLYMQRFCAAKYQGVLRQCCVDVVDVGSDGITVLYLQPPAGMSGDMSALRQAHLALQQLYQQLEVSLRKEKIAKGDLDLDSQALRALTHELQKLYPQVLCHEDEKQLYLIGNLVDVSQAKQFLQGLSSRRGAAHTLGVPSSSLPSRPATSHTAEAALHEPKAPVDTSASRLSPGRTELKGELKLAANFSSKADRSQASQGLLLTQGPPAVGQAQLSGEPVSETGALGPSGPAALTQQYQPHVSTRDAVLGSAGESQQKDPKEWDHVKGGARVTRASPFGDKENSTSRHPGPTKHHPLTSMPCTCDTRTSPASDSKPSESRPVLRRSSSFSLPRAKESDKSPGAGRAGSGGSRVSEEMSLDSLQWSYLKDACRAAVDDLCRDGVVQISEHRAGDCTVLTLQAPDQNKLLQAKWKVEALVQKCPDLVCQSMSYSELAVDGPDDSALSELCGLLRGKSLQIGLSKDKYKLYLACPKEVLPAVTEAFHLFSSRRLHALKSSSLSQGPESTGHSSVVQPSRSQDRVLGAALPGSLEALQMGLQHLSISDKRDHANGMRAVQLPEAEEKRSASPWKVQQGQEQEEANDHVDAGAVLGGSSLLSPSGVDNPSSPGLRESQEEPKRKSSVGEPDSARLKQVLPDKFQFARDKSRGGHHDVMGQLRSPVPAADGSPRSLPTWLYRPVAAEAAAKPSPAAEPRGENRDLVPAGRSNVPEEPDLSPQQTRGPSLGQESDKTPLGQCDVCQGSGVTCWAPCGHAMCRTCFAVDSTQPACCSSSSVALSHKISGTFQVSSPSQSLPDFQEPTLQIVYNIPDGVQGVGTHHRCFPIPVRDVQWDLSVWPGLGGEPGCVLAGAGGHYSSVLSMQSSRVA